MSANTKVSPAKLLRNGLASCHARRPFVNAAPRRTSGAQRCRAYKVEIEHPGGVASFDVEEGDTILETALSAGLDLSHDCKMGVCMTCPAKLLMGEVDQSAGMLDEEAKEKGYTLLCVSEPRTDCRIKVIEEDEILEQVLCSSANAG